MKLKLSTFFFSSVLSSVVLSEIITITSTRDYRIPTTAAVLIDGNTNLVTVTRSSVKSQTTKYSDGNISDVTNCHLHGTTQYCIDDNGIEGFISPAPTNNLSAAVSYTSCHTHSASTFCINEYNSEVQFIKEAESRSNNSGGRNCHFHAGVEHCVDDDGSESESCERIDREYDVRLRIGLLFAILAGSSIGVYSPILVSSWLKFNFSGVISNCFKQFGTGIIISTAFVHLITHANLMWSNSCITLSYESTGSAITMAGLLISFLIEYFSLRFTSSRVHLIDSQNDGMKHDRKVEQSKINKYEIEAGQNSMDSDTSDKNSNQDKLTCAIIECGILFHSILLGITLVVAGDSYFITLFIVILFHQMFEGIALGSRIAELKNSGIITKCIMALFFALITPIGMAIGIGVLHKFNGNDKSTIIALGTLDSFSAGILIWTGVVDMWYKDWIQGNLISSSWSHITFSFISLLSGLILMSVLGKWA